MKSCSYCGRENKPEAVRCWECGTQFSPAVTPSSMKVQPKPQPEPELPDPEPDVLPNEEAALCPSCLFPNRPEVDWCKRCGAPISSTASIIMPHAAYTVGFVFRRALTGYPRPIVFWSVWLMFSTKIFLTLCTLGFSIYIWPTTIELLTLLCYGAFNIGVSAYILHRITWNRLNCSKQSLAASEPT